MIHVLLAHRRVLRKRNPVWDFTALLLSAFAIGAAVGGPLTLCAYFGLRYYANYYDARFTRLELNIIQKAIEDQRRATGRLPATLAN